MQIELWKGVRHLCKEELFQKIKGQLIISAQAVPGEPLYDENTTLMDRMALAAKQAGAPMIRTSSVRDVCAIKKMTGLPVIGLIKIQYPGFDRYITPTLQEVDALVQAEAEIIAIDCTDQVRGDGQSIEAYMKSVREKYPEAVLMADISTYEEGLRAEALGFDLVGTTMSGYTPQSPKKDGPDYALVRKLVRSLSIPVIAEGKVHTPQQAVKMLKEGAFAVVVGGAVTRPLEIASRFYKAVAAGRASVPEILEKMILFSKGQFRDINHFLKVHTYAQVIGQMEGLDEETQYLLEVAAITHDIACPFCREKYGSAAGPLQEKEGGPMVRTFLDGCGLSETEIERIVFLVSHHHSPNVLDGQDGRILLEADFLVNAEESGYSQEQIQKAKVHVFQTESGIRMLENLLEP